MATHLKFEVFDVYDRKESKVSIIRLHVQEQNMPCVYPLADLYIHVSCLLSCPVCVQMCPIGLAQSKVMELIRSPNQSQRLDITFDGGTCGYLHIKAWKVGRAPHPHTLTSSHPSQSQDSESAAAVYQLGTAATRPRPPELGTPPSSSSSSSSYSEAITNFTYTSPMDNIVIRNFLFPVRYVHRDRLPAFDHRQLSWWLAFGWFFAVGCVYHYSCGHA